MHLRVTTPVGAEIDAPPLPRLTDEDVAELRGALAEHGVVVLRGQPVDDTDFVAFLRRLGELSFTKGETPVPGCPELNLISNVGRAEPPRSTFHVDTSYVARPPAYTALRAVTIPARGGETLFSNQYRACDTLPDELRADLAGRTMRHVVTGIAPGLLTDDDEQAAEHPLLRPHPLTGRTALYLTTPARCASISGKTAEQTEELVRLLFAHSTAEDNVHRHAWQPGDVVVWDNRCVMHRADHAAVSGDRVMHRGVVLERAA